MVLNQLAPSEIVLSRVYETPHRGASSFENSGQSEVARKTRANPEMLFSGDLAGQVAGGQLHCIQPDHLVSPRLVVDPQRDVAIWRWDLRGEAFGSDAPAEDPDQDGVALRFDLRFPGQRHDSVSGLNYNYFRDYEPATGRYLQSDPIGLEGGWSTYGYVGGDPVSYVDPFGLVGDPLANYRPVYGPIKIKTPTTPIGWAERLISGYVVGKVTSGTVGVNKYGQLVPKTSSLLGGSLFAVSESPRVH